MLALNSTAWGGVITIVMLIGFVGVVIAWWLLMGRRAPKGE
jgi:hypothetical protein